MFFLSLPRGGVGLYVIVAFLGFTLTNSSKGSGFMQFPITPVSNLGYLAPPDNFLWVPWFLWQPIANLRMGVCSKTCMLQHFLVKSLKNPRQIR